MRAAAWFSAAALCACAAAGAVAAEFSNAEITASNSCAGARFVYSGWAPQGLKDGEGAVYLFLEWGRSAADALAPLMASGELPSGICLFTFPGTLPATLPGGAARWMRAAEYDQIGPEFPSFLADELVPDAERRLGVKASRNPDLHFIAGASSGGIAAWNACWFRNDFFRLGYLNSPTFSAMRGGETLMPLARKSETRPIRAWITAGTDEPDYFFGDSYFVALDAMGALRFAGYDVRSEVFPGEGHGARWCSSAHLAKVAKWLFRGWRTEPVRALGNPVRVRDFVVAGELWRPSAFKMPPPVREVVSTDKWRVYSVDPGNRFVMAASVDRDGTRGAPQRQTPLTTIWDVRQPGGFALALCADDRLLVATEAGVQGVVAFGLADFILPLPGDLPADNVALVGNTLYAASGDRVFERPVKVAAADPAAPPRAPATPGYDDGFWYSRDHQVAGEPAVMFTNPVWPKDFPDPVVWKGAGDTWYASSTTHQILESEDLVHWRDTGRKLLAPKELADVRRTYPNVWAPDVVKFGDRWNLYLAFHNTGAHTAIAAYESDSPEGPFTNRHVLITSEGLGVFETIDPAVVRDPATGKVWLFFGHRDVRRVELTADGLALKPGAKPEHVAGITREAPTPKEGEPLFGAQSSEGPYLHFREGKWYLFFSQGYWTDHTYRLVVGRADRIDGAYFDKEGRPLADGWGTVLLASEKGDRFFGPGHNGNIVETASGRTYMFYHSHDAKCPKAKPTDWYVPRPLMLQEVRWGADGWPYFFRDRSGRPSLKPANGEFVR